MSRTSRMQACLSPLPTALDPLFHVVLVEPRMPANTGNIARTCAATGCALHVVGQPAFDLAHADTRRAGLDYWPSVDLHCHPDLPTAMDVLGPRPWFFFTARTELGLYDVELPRGAALVFGREDTGLPQDILDAHAETCLRLPMRDAVRSMNLSNCVAIAVFEGLRQVAMRGETG